MSNLQAVTMQELELETAELLPSRETLNCVHTASHPSGNSFSQSNWGIGNSAQAGGVGGLVGNLSALNGNLSGNTVIIGW
jgi:hypothetical protein